jgi:Fe-S-cluster-containing hydrogenase component 2
MIHPETGKTMSCDLCMDDTDDPWCVRACAMQQALQFVDAGDAARSRGREWAKKLKTEYEPAAKDNQDFTFSFSTT